MTRSLLGWGVVAGAFYLTVGIVHGVVEPAFSFTEHPLSSLMLAPWGWVQATNLILTGVMVLAAAVGFYRSVSPAAMQRRAGTAVGIYGVALILSGIFEPDPVDGFPDATSTETTTTTSGFLHLTLGGVGLVALAASAVFIAQWYSGRGERQRARRSKAGAGVVGVGLVGGAALAATPVGVVLLWIAVVTGWAWLADTSIFLYRTVPHPDLHLRAAQQRA